MSHERGAKVFGGRGGWTFFMLDINFNEEEKTRQEIPLFKKGVSQSERLHLPTAVYCTSKRYILPLCTCAANYSFAQLAKGKKSRP